jgi:hypothetical protein
MTRLARIPRGGGRGSAGRGAGHGGAGRGGAGHGRAGRAAASRAGTGAERGSVTVFVVFFTLVALALASLLVDVAMP